jgi:hypothetical protein
MDLRRWRSAHVGRVRRGVVRTKTKAPDRFMFATALARIWLRGFLCGFRESGCVCRVDI